MALKQLSVLAAAILMASCAGLQPAGRNAAREAEPIPAAAPATGPTNTTPPTTESAPAAAPVAAPDVSAPAPTPRPASSGNDIVVPGEPERQVPPPQGDPRSLGERMEDIRAWDQCVTAVQAAFESDPMRPQLETPEDYCSHSLGMASRNAVPESRRRRP